MKKYIARLLATATILVASALPAQAQTEDFSQPAAANPTTSQVVEGRVTKIVEERLLETMGQTQHYQKLEIQLTTTDQPTITVEHGQVPNVRDQTFQVGDRVQLMATTVDGQTSYQISDHVRRLPLLALGIIFAGLVLLINFKKGLASLLSLGITFVVIFAVVLPLILSGIHPVAVAIMAALVLIPTTYFLSHGFNRKTAIAAIGTLFSLTVAIALAQYFISATRLTGYASDEAGFLQTAMQGQLDIQGLILASIVLGLVGVLDDVTITQAGFIQQLRQAQPTISPRELYARAMVVGRDHIASLVNTLILVYTSAAMPLLLLFSQTGRPFLEVINYEIIAEEVVRTLIVSIGIVISVPVTTYLGAKTIDWPLWKHKIFNTFTSKEDHAHHHDL